MSVMPVLNKELIAEIDEANAPPAAVEEVEVGDGDFFKSDEDAEVSEEEVAPPTIKIKQVAPVPPPPKKKYPHLERARAKGLITRRARAAERKQEREKIKAEKARISAEKKEARKEKNKDRARENYWRKKLGVGNATTVASPEEVVNTVPPAVKPVVSAPIMSSSMTYEKFSGFMDAYNHKKISQYNEIQEKKKKAKQSKEIEDKKNRSTRLGNPIISRRRTKGLFVESNDYPNDLFF